ncbi:MAG: hypothetical protein H6735_28170 [Alphaproteobacteria bacterium]|nr:hypothetical protein [Alphaproteobacteria bacterium]
MSDREVRGFRPLALLVWVVLLAFFFANVEVQIEGANGWASALPVTFRVDQHWLLDLFWGGRPLTGYHAWVFSFVALTFHLPLVWEGRWSWRAQARALALISGFWIVEDALWFVLNPAYGWAALTPANVPWHVHWFLGLPTDYWTFGFGALALYAASWWRRST